MNQRNNSKERQIEEEYWSHAAAGEEIKKMIAEYKFKHYTVTYCEGKDPKHCGYCKSFFAITKRKPSVMSHNADRRKRIYKKDTMSAHA